jgi:hypothetical protein
LNDELCEERQNWGAEKALISGCFFSSSFEYDWRKKSKGIKEENMVGFFAA